MMPLDVRGCTRATRMCSTSLILNVALVLILALVLNVYMVMVLNVYMVLVLNVYVVLVLILAGTGGRICFGYRYKFLVVFCERGEFIPKGHPKKTVIALGSGMRGQEWGSGALGISL